MINLFMYFQNKKKFIAAMIISQFQVYMHYNMYILLVGNDVMGALVLTLDDTDDSLQFEDIDALM